ncbi:10399_t:CDS:2, partial [Ambispora leptoticha]
KESSLPLRWCRVLTIIIFSYALCTSFIILIAKLVNEVPAIKVTYKYKEFIPTPNNFSYDSNRIYLKYLKSNLSFAEDVRKNVEQISQTDL